MGSMYVQVCQKKSSGYVSDSIKIEFHSEAVKSEDYLRVKIKS